MTEPENQPTTKPTENTTMANDTDNTATAQALTTPSGSRLDFSILPRHLKSVCKCNGFPLSMEQEALITGCLAAIQSQIEEDGLETTIYAFSPANDEFTS